MMESNVSNDPEKQEQLLAQFAINYESVMTACSEMI